MYIMKSRFRNFISGKNKYIVIAIGICLISILILGGKKVYSYLNITNNRDYLANVRNSNESIGKEDFIKLSSITPVNCNNPFIIRGDDNRFYLYGTGISDGIETGSIGYYASEDGVDWNGVNEQEIDIPDGSSNPISPKVYKIGNTYYLIFTLINSSNKSAYSPYNSNTTASVYYATSTSLNDSTKWSFKGEVPYGLENSFSNVENYENSDKKNLNHLNGSLFIEDTSANAELDASDEIYFYYHLEGSLGENSRQQSYSVKLNIRDGLFVAASEPSLLISGFDMVDDPYVIKENGKYKLYFSTNVNESDLYTYNVAYAENTESKANGFSIVNSKLLSDRYAGGMSIFQTYIKSTVGGKSTLYSDNYYVFHRTLSDTSIPAKSNAFFNIRKDLTKSASIDETSVIPNFSGVKSKTYPTKYRTTVDKEKYTVTLNGDSNYKDIDVVKNDVLKLDFDTRLNVREILIYTDATNSDNFSHKSIINDGTLSETLYLLNYNDSEQSWSSSSTSKKYNGLIRILVPVDNAKLNYFTKNISINIYNNIGKINDIEVVALSDNQFEYDDYFYVDYTSKKPSGAIVTNCDNLAIKSTDIYTNTCSATLKNYDFTYTNEKDVDHYNKVITSDYSFDYMFEPTIYTIKYNYAADANELEQEYPSEIKYAIARIEGNDKYNDVVLSSEIVALENPLRTGYTFSKWVNSKNAVVTYSTVRTTLADYDLTAVWTANTVNVTYNANGGKIGSNATQKIAYKYDAAYTHPTPTYTGYIFQGWFTDVDSTEPVENGTIIKNPTDHTLIAKWIEGTYNVTFDTQGGSLVDSREIKYNEEYGTLPETKRNGYTFSKWTLDKVGGTVTVSATSKSPDRDHTIYANWTANKVTVTFDSNGGSSVASVQKVFDSAYGSLSNSTRKGYTFQGWFNDKGEQVTSTTIVSDFNPEGHTLTAHWEPIESTITLDLNKGSGSTEPDFDGYHQTITHDDGTIDLITNNTVRVKYDETYKILPTPFRVGYDFAGWYTARTGGDLVKPENTVNITSGITLYARWTAKSINVTYDYQNGSALSDPIQVNFDSKYPTATAEYKNYTLLGWFDSSTGGNQITLGSTTVTNPVEHTIYAHWRGNQHNVVYNANGGKIGTASTKTIASYYNEKYNFPDVPTRGGYKFIGWYTAADGGSLIKDTTKFNKTTDITLYAHWEITSYLVTFESNGGSKVDSVKFLYGDKYKNLPTPEREGYDFAGWYSTPSFASGTKIEEGANVSIVEDSTFYAKWTAIKVTVDFDSQGGSEVVSVEKTFDSAYGTLSSPKKSGYVFVGWYIGDDKVETTTLVKNAKEHTLVAHYRPNKFNIILNPNGGDQVKTTVEVEFDGTFENLPKFTRTGYDFNGWYSAATGGTKYDITSNVSFTSNDGTSINFYAQWKPVSYEVKYDANGGEEVNQVDKYDFASNYSNLPTTTRAGYDFAGWYDAEENGNKIISTTKVSIAKNHTLYAYWTPKVYTVTLDKGSGTFSVSSIKVSYQSKYEKLPTTGTKNGYNFVGWIDTFGNPVKNDDIYNTIGDQTLYAQWEATKYTVTYGFNGNKTKEFTIESDDFTLEEPEARDGYTFTGYTGPNYSTANKTVVIKKGTIGDREYKANWSKINYTYIVDGKAYTYDVEKDDITLTIPTKNGYTFAGWEGTGIDKPQPSVTIAKGSFGNKEYTSTWTPTQYTIKYGDKTRTYTIETASFVLEEPEARAGYEFAGYIGDGYTSPTKVIKINKGTTGNKSFEEVWNTTSGDSVSLISTSDKKGQKASDFLASNKRFTKILNSDRSSKKSDDLIKTGDIAIDSNKKETIIIVSMDVNGDGKITALDYIKVWNHLDKKNPNSLDGDEKKYSRLAADVNGDGKITALDYIKIWNKLASR